MELKDIRKGIDSIDDQIVDLYKKRMELVKQVADAKKKGGTPTFDPNREREILFRVTNGADNDIEVYIKRVFEMLFETSKAYQTINADYSSELGDKIDEVLSTGLKKFPNRAKVACQGVAGAYSGIATDRMFELADISYFKNFEGVFSAVEKGFCQYGVLPIENSSAGSVNQVYDLMK